MLPMILCHLQQLLEMKEELELVIQILSDILMLLHRQDVVSELVRCNLEYKPATKYILYVSSVYSVMT